MLATNHYAQEYVDEGRARVDLQLSRYAALATVARSRVGAGGDSLNSAIESFEPVFANNMVLVLDGYFVHRTRTIEKKDGNPLNEADLLLISKAFFAEIGSKFVAH